MKNKSQLYSCFQLQGSFLISFTPTSRPIHIEPSLFLTLNFQLQFCDKTRSCCIQVRKACLLKTKISFMNDESSIPSAQLGLKINLKKKSPLLNLSKLWTRMGVEICTNDTYLWGVRKGGGWMEWHHNDLKEETTLWLCMLQLVSTSYINSHKKVPVQERLTAMLRQG